MSRPLLLAIVLAVGLAAPAARAQGFGPFGNTRHPVTRDARPAARPGAGARPPETFLRVAYDFYRIAISPIDGPSCYHRPTCSRYALDAVRRHQLVGLWLAVDRLWRTTDSSAVRRLRLLDEGDTLAFHDPLEDSTFWLPPSP